ncbi:hypothetical protein JCGZ_10307 [Jatropha curcas]|uniref:Uncharacterized protein n=1 Tax=Jatropha curcas TaxID=180498 RepID=A0A067KUU5_JATCU|nr:hypothetical protein JCGZ_10307 [Jatropha curcas]
MAQSYAKDVKNHDQFNRQTSQKWHSTLAKLPKWCTSYTQAIQRTQTSQGFQSEKGQKSISSPTGTHAGEPPHFACRPVQFGKMGWPDFGAYQWHLPPKPKIGPPFPYLPINSVLGNV